MGIENQHNHESAKCQVENPDAADESRKTWDAKIMHVSVPLALW